MYCVGTRHIKHTTIKDVRYNDTNKHVSLVIDMVSIAKHRLTERRIIMSRTYKDKPGYRRRIVKNKFLKGILGVWGEDFKHRRKDRSLSRLARARINRKKVNNEKE